jgi:hypothetical protein
MTVDLAGCAGKYLNQAKILQIWSKRNSSGLRQGRGIFARAFARFRIEESSPSRSRSRQLVSRITKFMTGCVEWSYLSRGMPFTPSRKAWVSASRELLITSVAACVDRAYLAASVLPFLSDDRTPGVYENART